MFSAEFNSADLGSSIDLPSRARKIAHMLMISRGIKWPVRICLVWALSDSSFAAGSSPLFQTLDIDQGETRRVTLQNGEEVSIELLKLSENRGDVWGEVYHAAVSLKVNGESVSLVSGMYRLPVTAGGVQIDCPITGGLKANSHMDHWALEKDARLRVWPKESPWIRPGTFGYPVNQTWFASQTSFSNEPVAPRPKRLLYYHAGLDIGGAEGLVDIMAATDALVVSRGDEVLAGHEKDTPVEKRYDVLYLLDDRGWYYRYSHLQSFDDSVTLGGRVKLGQKIGTLGKEGGSGGWTHLHFEVKSRQPSGRWGTQEGYAFLWQSYLQRHKPDLIAVARPGHVVFAGQTVELDGSRSWSRSGNIAKYDWTFANGETAGSARVRRIYHRPGSYYETLRVTDSLGRVDYDFVRVRVFDRKEPDVQPPRLHATFFPNFDLKPGQPITFKVRAFYNTHGEEIWDFGDGSPDVRTKSDGNIDQRAKDGYAILTHSYSKPGDYLVHVRRPNEKGHHSEDRLHVRVSGR